MSAIFQDKSLIITNRIINNLVAAEEQAKIYTNNLNELQNELRSVETKRELYNVVQKLIVVGKNIHQFLTEKTNGAGQEDMAKVMTDLARRPHCKNIITLLNYTEIATTDIIATKEKLSKKMLLMNLTRDQSVAAVNFINGLKDLKPIAELINDQKKQFKDRIEQADSLDALDAIEFDIQLKNKATDGVLEELVSYPTDEVVAGKLIKFLEINTHLMDVLQSFDMHELLMDDILNARATLSASYENKLGA